MPFYLAPEAEAVQAAEAEIYAAFREQYRLIDPEAVQEDGSIVGRNGATGELEPSATRTTGYFGAPLPAVQGFYHPVPADETLQLPDPASVGVEVVERLNAWPALGLRGEAPPLPEWVQPTGAHDAPPLGYWCQRKGLNYESLIPANVYEPTPESNYWRVSPPLPPQPWKMPESAMDAYALGVIVTHTVEGRDTDLWESLIDANTAEPGGDGEFDRYWKPLYDTAPEVAPWVQPMPGTANKPYDVNDMVTCEGGTHRNTIPLNVWPPVGPGAFGWEPVAEA